MQDEISIHAVAEALACARKEVERKGVKHQALDGITMVQKEIESFMDDRDRAHFILAVRDAEQREGVSDSAPMGEASVQIHLAGLHDGQLPSCFELREGALWSEVHEHLHENVTQYHKHPA